MPSKRKLWATSFPRIVGDKRRHESQAAAYRYVEAEAANWSAGALRSQYLTVWVDERNGFGWSRFEEIERQRGVWLAAFGGAHPRVRLAVAARGVGAGHVDDRGYGSGAAAALTVEYRRRAVRFVAGSARDAGDAAHLLDLLGLDPVEGRNGKETAA